MDPRELARQDPSGSPPRFIPSLITFIDPTRPMDELERLATENVALKAAEERRARDLAHATILVELLKRQVIGSEPPVWLVALVEHLGASVLQDDRAFAVEHGVGWTPARRWFHHGERSRANRMLFDVARDLLREMRAAASVIHVVPLVLDDKTIALFASAGGSP